MADTPATGAGSGSGAPLLDAESIVETVREPLLVLDGTFRVQRANRSFYRTFRVEPAETEGRLLYDLGNRQWNIPALRKLLEDILPQNTAFDDYEVVHDFPSIGRRVMVLNARRVYREGNRTELILLAIEDMTERHRAEEALTTQQEWQRVTLGSIGDAVIATDAASRVTFLNPAAEALTGWTAQEATALPLETVYLRDPDDNGVELYWDRPQGAWPRTPQGGLAMFTRRLDLDGLLREAESGVNAPEVDEGPQDL